jgi:hypothetical protein
MIRATFSTPQQKIDEIVWEKMFIKTYYTVTNDCHGYLLLLGYQCYAHNPSHSHTSNTVWTGKPKKKLPEHELISNGGMTSPRLPK